MTVREFNPLNHLAAIRAFEAAARRGSFKAAANELSVTASAVSRLIRQLEEASGVPLFERLHRQVKLTEPGLVFSDNVRASLARLRSAGEILTREIKGQPFTIAAPATFLLRWLIPRQSDLQAQLGVTPIHLATWDNVPDLADPTITMFISVGALSHVEGARYVHLMPERFGLVVSPLRLEQYPTLEACLADIPRLVPKSRPRIWESWVAEGGANPPFSGIREYERMHFTMDAAEAGVGSAIAPVDVIRDSIDAGRLITPFGAIRRVGTYRIYVPPRYRHLETVMEATRWFKANCKATLLGTDVWPPTTSS